MAEDIHLKKHHLFCLS